MVVLVPQPQPKRRKFLLCLFRLLCLGNLSNGSYKSYLEPSSSTSSSTSTSSNSSSTSPLAAVPRSSKHRWMASKNDEQEHENGANVSVLLLVKNVSLKRSPITTYHISFSLTLASLIQLFMYFYWRSTVNLLLCEISSLY